MTWTKKPEARVKFEVAFRSGREDPNMVRLANEAHERMLTALVEWAKENGCEPFFPKGSHVLFRFKEGKRP